MEVIHLPLLSSYASSQDAVRSMELHQKAAVVRADSANYSLIRAVDIYSGLAHNVSLLRALQSKFPMHEISNRDISQWGLDVAHPGQTGDRFEHLLDQVNKKYAVLDFISGIVRVVTRHEHLARQFEFAPTACYCDNEDYMHPYPPPNVSAGDKCHCGHTISCR